MATSLELTRYSAPELVQFRSYRDRNLTGADSAANGLGPYALFVVPLGIMLAAISTALLANGYYPSFSGGILAGSLVVTGVLLWAALRSARSTKKERLLWAKASEAHAETTGAIETWLSDSYGLTVDDYWSAADLATMALQSEIDPTPWSLRTRSGAKVEGRFKEVAPGVIELQKASVADIDESPYFRAASI